MNRFFREQGRTSPAACAPARSESRLAVKTSHQAVVAFLYAKGHCPEKEVAMRTPLFSLVILLSGLFLLTAGTVYAEDNRVQVDVPFAFTVADKVFPADAYIAARLHLFSPVLCLGTPDLPAQIMFTTNSLGTAPNREVKPRFVFRRYGDQYFLAQVWLGGAVGREISKSNKERQIARQTSEPEQIYITAK
jgi:hypothetical protein